MSKIYCVFCGEENNSSNKKCKNKDCNRELNPKSHLFRNYVIDKFKGEVDDSLFKLIIKFLKGNLYGMVLSVSIVTIIAIVISNSLSNNYITELKEEPIFTYAKKNYVYSGTGLSRDEIIDKYLEYVQNGDVDGANTLIAENFLTQEQLANVPISRLSSKDYRGIKHDFIDSNYKFFGNIKHDGLTIDKDNYVGRFSYFDYIEPDVIHNSRFDLYSYYMELEYCLANDCNNTTVIMEILETIEIEGNTYILSEYAFLTDNYSRVVRYMFDTNNGDFRNLDNDGYYRILDSCLDENGTIICDYPIPEFGEE